MKAPRIGTLGPNSRAYAPTSPYRWTSRPVTVPSRRAVIVMSWIWSRPWCAASSDSDLDSVYFTGLPSARATSRQRTSSGATAILPPNPPPTSGAMTRILCSGMPRVAASNVRRTCGICVADQIVTASPTGWTTVERGSMNAGIRRCWTKRRLTATSAVSSASWIGAPVPAAPDSNSQR
jgi:hypothetical protein